MLLTERDERVVQSIRRVCDTWGGEFFVRTVSSWREEVLKWKASGGLVVHLTMYGLPVDHCIRKLRGKKIMVVVGAEKVPSEVFRLADFNVAIGHQPHSEVAALAVFMDRLFEGRELATKFANRKIEIIPCERGKRVVRKDGDGFYVKV
jgi:tRNA (cytidine56-2'-O)-methyltransferase